MEAFSLTCGKEKVKDQEDNMEAFSLTCGKEKEQDREGNIEDAMTLLKRRISGHPLYEVLIQAHLDCLKVGGIFDLDQENYHSKNVKQQLQVRSKPNLGAPKRQSELDDFMEAYCLALGKLKEAMEEPQQESMAFFSNMQLQLKELTESHLVESLGPPTLQVKARNDTVG